MKKIYLFFALCLMSVMNVHAANVSTVTGTGDFYDVKGCQIDANSFNSTGEVTLAIFTESNWYFADDRELVKPGGFGFIYLICITPNSLEDLSGTYVFNSNTGSYMLEYVNNHLTTYQVISGSATITKVSKRQVYEMDIQLALSVDDVFEGTISGISNDFREVISSVELEGFDISWLKAGATWTDNGNYGVYGNTHPANSAAPYHVVEGKLYRNNGSEQIFSGDVVTAGEYYYFMGVMVNNNYTDQYRFQEQEEGEINATVNSKEWTAYNLYGDDLIWIKSPVFSIYGQGVENVQSDDVQCTKVMENGVLYLMYNGTKYNVQGAEVK